MAEKVLGGTNGGRIVALFFQQTDKLFQGGQKCLAQAVALRQNPFVVATGQEIAVVQIYRIRQGLPHG